MKRHLAKILTTILLGSIIYGCQEQQYVSEWNKLPSPISAQIRCFVESSDGTYYVGTSELYKSEDQGNTWQLMEFKQMPLEVMETQDGSLLVGTYRGGIFRSTDQGETWTNVGFENNVYIFKIIQISDGKIFASATFARNESQKDTQTGVFISEDDGLTWKVTSITVENIKGVFNPKSELIFASGTGENNFHRSADNGLTWSTNVIGIPDSIPVSAIVDTKGILFASVGDPQDAARTIGGGIYKSKDDGLTWTKSDDGISDNTKVSDIALIENTLLVSTGYPINIGDRGIFKSTDLGQTWKSTGLNDSQLRLLRTTSNGQLIAGSNVSSIFISNNKGNSWSQAGKGIENWSVFQVLENNNFLFASGESGIWRAAKPVSEWKQIKKELGSLVKLSNGNILMAENGVILRSENNGDTWESISELKSEMIFLYAIDASLLIACAQGDGVFYSTNNGKDWLKYNLAEFEKSRFRTAIKTSNETLLIGATGGTLRSTDQGKTWEKVDNEFYVWSFAETVNAIYAGVFGQGVRRSIDDGLTWTEFNLGLREGDDYLTVTSLCVTSDNSLICGTLGEGIYKLKSNDSLWREYKTGLTDLVNFGIIEGDKRELYTTSEKGIFERN